MHLVPVGNGVTCLHERKSIRIRSEFSMERRDCANVRCLIALFSVDLSSAVKLYSLDSTVELNLPEGTV